MKIEIGSGCSHCGLCLSACPRMPDKKDYKIFDCPCDSKSCLSVCPRNAIFEASGVIAIDRQRCSGCGDCLKVCKNKAIIAQRGYYSKCDLCIETGGQRCVEACPNNSLSLVYDESEREKIKEIVGWRKIRYNIEKKLEDTDGFQIVRVSGKEEPIFSVRIREIGYDEALLVSKVLEEFRESSEDYSEKTISEIVDSYCAKKGIALKEEDRRFIGEQIKSEVSGYSVLDELVNKDCLEEIAVIDKNSPVYVYHKKFGWLETDIQIDSERKIIDLINKMSRSLGRRVTLQKPRLNADIKLGRIHAAISPISASPSLTIRKFNKEPFTPYDLIANKTISSEALAFLWLAVQCDFNILICGNTGSGKTSTLNTLFSFVPKNERIIVIEETPEIVLPHKHLVKLVVNEELKIDFSELITDTLRMRPDRIIVGEVRSAKEALALVNTMLAGQGKGSFSTFHATTGSEALVRLKSLGVSAVDLGAIDLIIVQRRWTRYLGKPEDVRRVIEIDAVEKTNEPRIERLFGYDQKKDRLARAGFYDSEAFRKICFNFGFSRKKFEGELKRRTVFLETKPENFAHFFDLASRVMRDGN